MQSTVHREYASSGRVGMYTRSTQCICVMYIKAVEYIEFNNMYTAECVLYFKEPASWETYTRVE